MYVAEAIMERLSEQIKAAPRMEIAELPGVGTPLECWQQSVIDVLTENMNRAHHIPMLRAVESGARRYSKKCEAALNHLLPLTAVFTEIGNVQGAAYADGVQREKSLARLKDKPQTIINACKAAIGELESAIKIMDEGERKDAQLGAAK